MSKTKTPLMCRPNFPVEHSKMGRWFPVPTAASLPGAGVDISDSSVKWLTLKPITRGWAVATYGNKGLPEGVVVEGIVRDPKALGSVLAEVKMSDKRVSRAHAALPEEAAYVFSIQVPDVWEREHVLNIVEFELEGRVPLRAKQAVYDYDIVAVHPDGKGAEIGVTVFPADVVNGYVEAFAHSGIELLSLELEARSIARAVVPADSMDVSLLADFGRARTGIAIIKRQVPIFTSTVSVGGDTLTNIIVRELSITPEKAEDFKNEHGILESDHKKLSEVIMATAVSLSDEVVRHYQYWDTKRDERENRVTPVARVVLAGGSANLKGLSEYIAGRVQAPTTIARVWENVCFFDDYIPPIEMHHSLGLATAIGLAMRSI